MKMTLTNESVAIVYEDKNPIRLFKGKACIYKAYRWCHHHFCLDLGDKPLPLHKLPDYLEVKFFMMNEEQINSLIK